MEVKLIINDNIISSYYAQTLCLLMWKRASFPDCLDDDHLPRCVFSGKEDENGVYAKAKIITENGSFSGEFFSEYREKLYMDTKAAVCGRAFVLAMKDAGGTVGPWGLLTGVRPAKPLLIASRSGKDPAELERLLTDTFLVSPDKAKLCADVAKSENALCAGITKRSFSIYISVPFCPTRCAYCSFISYAVPNLMKLIPDYVDRICDDIRRIKDLSCELSLELTSIYIGGGTPTALDATSLEKVLSVIDECFDVGSLREFCVEAGRPDTIDRNKLEILKKYNVGRISINPQTLSDKTLQVIGRRHTVSDFYAAYKLAKEVGFDTVNTDLILGLPGESGADFEKSVEGVLALEPENITAHSFCIKKAADLAQDPKSLDAGDILPSQRRAFDMIGKNGYAPYYIYRQKNAVGDLENIGFTKKGHECIYNVLMMEELQTVIGIGAGASTRLVGANGEISRIVAPKYPYEYKDYSLEVLVNGIRDFYENNF